jgi:hypothetical protein
VAAASCTPPPQQYLPIISSPNVCALPPGNIATDRCDDVCLLTECCDGWQNGNSPTSPVLQNRMNVDCASVDCGNVCRMACDRVGTSEACNSTCSIPTPFDGQAYVFSRKGFCNPDKYPFVGRLGPTHVGFGFAVSPGIYVFGSVEDTAGLPLIVDGDNQYWMATGTLDQMMATFLNPRSSGFHGALLAKPYDQYRTATIRNPLVCAAVQSAETLYNTGYVLIGNNCLDAVYNVLTAYGFDFGDVNPDTYICPSGPEGWFAGLSELSNPKWSAPAAISAGGSPATPGSCATTTIPSTCSSMAPAQPTQPAPAECSSDPPQYASVSDYCKTLCRRVCAVTVCSTTFEQQDFVDACYDDCACQTEGLSFDGICVSGVGTPEPGLVFCYDAPGCPPTNGQYFSQADLTSYSQIFNVPFGTCPLGQANLIDGN